MCGFMLRELDFMLFVLRSTCSGAESQFRPRQERFRVNAANALSTKLARSRWSLSLCFFVTRKKGKKQDDSSVPDSVCPVSHGLIMLEPPWCSGVCHHACSHLSAYMGGRCTPKLQREQNLDIQHAQSHTHRAHPHTHFHADTTLTTLVQWCATAPVQPLFRGHGCCDRSEGKHLPHSTALERQQSGRCRRCCTCRSL